MQALGEQTQSGFYAVLRRSLEDSKAPLSKSDCFGFREFLDVLDTLQRRKRRLVILIDEFEIVARNRGFSLAFFDNLRSAATLHSLTLVVGSVGPLAKIAHDGVTGSPFFNIFIKERLGLLSSRETSCLICHPGGRESGLAPWQTEVRSITGEHPFFLQLACAHLWGLCRRKGVKPEVLALQAEILKSAYDHHRYIWEHSSPEEQSSLRALILGERPDEVAVDSLRERGYVSECNPPAIFGNCFAEFVRRQSGSEGTTRRTRSLGLAPKGPPMETSKMRDNIRHHIFISYSHHDGKWLEHFKRMLRPLTRTRAISIWDDRRIDPGGKWKEQIQGALKSAKIAVLLVSPHFLDSDFIAKKELPPLLNAAEKDGLTIFWVLVSDCMYKETSIADFQAANDPAKPLDSLRAAERNKVLVSICEKLKRAGQSPAT
jgi:hypothetical protein